MSDLIPQPWEFALLALGAFRLSRLVGWDAITARWRWRLVGYHDDDELPDLDDERLSKRERRQAYLATLIRCPWCQGFYVSVGMWGLWAIFGDPVLYAMVPLAVSATVGLTAKNLDP